MINSCMANFRAFMHRSCYPDQKVVLQVTLLQVKKVRGVIGLL